MEIKGNNTCVKVGLPNGKVADVLTSVLDEIGNWIQDKKGKPESGGYIVGYQHMGTGNISLEAVSVPHAKDIKTPVSFNICDPLHNSFLRKARKQKSYYMGVWHTHPQTVPFPSDIDWADWNATIRSDITGCQYVFFIIVGTKEWRLWVGDLFTKEISEVHECTKNPEGLYIRENK